MPLVAGVVILTRWSSGRRTLPGGEVDDHFAAAASEVLLFAFRTDHMDVGCHGGNFSLKFVVEGEERYCFGRRALALRPGQLLLTNEGERYESAIRTRNTGAISIFLPRRVLAEAHPGSLEVVSVPFRPCTATLGRMRRLRAGIAAAREGESDELEEQVLEFVADATAENVGLFPARSPLRARRARHGRFEVVRRLLEVREYLEDLRGHATLEQMAAIACLSKFHFLRAFSDAFGITPARFARSLRVESGARALSAGRDAAAAARVAHYGSASAFLRAARSLARRKTAISASPGR